MIRPDIRPDMRSPKLIGVAAIGCALVCGLVCACATSRGGTEGGVLAGSEWRLVELNGQPAVGADLAGRPWLRLNVDSGRVEGSGGCNRLSGTMDRSGSSLTFGPLLTTKMACADAAVNRQEQEFLKALQATNRFEASADTLTLLRGSDRVARLVR
jgi:heat shock protein HslJ